MDTPSPSFEWRYPALRDSLLHLPDGLFIMDAEWKVRFYNKAASRISRFTPDQLGKSHWEIFPATAGTEVERLYRRVMVERLPLKMEPWFYEPFGVWVRVSAFPVEGGIAVHYSDVTAQVHAMQSAQRAEDRTTFALEAANGIGIFEWDIPSDRIRTSARFAGYFGVPHDSVMAGAPLAEFMKYVHPDDVASTSAAIQLAIETMGSYSTEYRLVQPDNSVVHVAAVGRVYPDDLGKPRLFTGIVMDVTERRRTEAALLQNEKLAAVGRLASSIAHEINNPLESVMNLIYLSHTDTRLSAETAHYLRMADQELRRVAAIVNQTLGFNRQSARPRRVSANDLYANVLAIYESRLRNLQIDLQTRDRDGIEVVCLDGEIRQVLHNLVGNAADALSGTLHGRLFVRSRAGTDWLTGRHGIYVTVADSGTGMTPETQRRLFEAFYSTKGIHGTGLGLWISSEIVLRHGGRLLLRSSQSKDHHGTVFSMFLPEEHSEVPSAG